MSSENMYALRRDEASAYFFDAASRGELLLKQCADGHWNPPQAQTCDACGAMQLQWTPSKGAGRIVSHAVFHRRNATPLPVAIVQLDEGPWLRGQLQDVDDVDLEAGLPVEVRFATPDGGETIPYFVPRG